MEEAQILTGSDELEQFYKDKFYFSYSSINKLLFSPRMFYSHYVLNQREDSVDSHLVKGRVIHCLLLDKDAFDDEFIIIPGKLPSGNNKMIVDEIFKLYTDLGDDSLSLRLFEKNILDLLEIINLHQKLKTDEARIKKILTDDNISYFDFLKKAAGKTLVDVETLNYCKECVMSVSNNTTVKQLLQLEKSEEDKHLSVDNEVSVRSDRNIFEDNLKYGFKGILDNVVIDEDKKQLFINDVKTTGKPLIDFADSVEYYKYWIQAAIYYNLAFYKYINNRKDKLEWGINFTFVVIDQYNQVYPFQVKPKTMEEWLIKFRNEVLPQLDYHYNTRSYGLPYKLALGKVTL
tara:strand:+ start:486 stop:1523 length:1038 start_codon:yes stop_codon:yes gene_type:complete